MGHKAQATQSAGPLSLAVSLRMKLLLGFSLVFTSIFAGTFYWFYWVSTQSAVQHIRADLLRTLNTATTKVNGDHLLALAQEAKPRPDGYTDDSRYWEHVQWLATVEQLEPRAYVYTYIAGPKPNSIVFIGSGSAINKNRNFQGAKFLESYTPTTRITAGLTAQTLSLQPYHDRWGYWISGYTPIINSQGTKVAALGVDFKADEVLQVQNRIFHQVLIAFGASYTLLLVLVYFISGILTRQLQKLTQAAAQISAGNYQHVQLPPLPNSFPDELNTLHQAFQEMLKSLIEREQLLAQGQKTENAMRQSLMQQRELTELKSRFVAMVSHELRTPLTVIQTSIEILEHYGSVASADKKRQYFERMRSSIHQMVQLLEDVLALNQNEADARLFQPISLDLNQFCQSLVESMILENHQSHPITFHSQGKTYEVQMDPILLHSILTQLLSNAIKYSAPGSPIYLNLFYQEASIILEVQDQGIGIPLPDQAHLFEVFHRAANATNIRGTGLGLVIVKQCVDRHHGVIMLTSQEEAGTMVRVQLPSLVTPISSGFSSLAV